MNQAVNQAANPQDNPAEQVIIALDCPREEAMSLAQQLKGAAHWLKVGMTLYYAAGPSIVSELKEMGYRVFIDLKLHDIPHQVKGAAASVVKAGADMLTVHGCGGAAMLKAAAEGAEQGTAERAEQGHKPLLLAITVLTSMDELTLKQVGVSRELEVQVESLALLATEAGLDGVVASPQEAQSLRTLLGDEAVIVTPGIRPSGAAIDDQSRIATPAQALQNGASHLVIGRPITAAQDPKAAFLAILDEIRRA
ncbi:MAG: orotidine-5'-phosphate decarboxylase [Coriobacteriia bacterium]|nr:orotidine-5'-phosphate decarboxylase [Coriobacteriia bacterium]